MILCHQVKGFPMLEHIMKVEFHLIVTSLGNKRLLSSRLFKTAFHAGSKRVLELMILKASLRSCSRVSNLVQTLAR
jgi:hypothetical protein